MKLSQVAKPPISLILSPTLRRRTRYAALMMLGIGMTLVAVAGSVSKDEAAAVGGWGVGFLVLSVVLLAVIGIAAVREQLAGVVARDVQNEFAHESSKDTPSTCDTSNPSNTPNTRYDNDLTDTERALIKLLRNKIYRPMYLPNLFAKCWSDGCGVRKSSANGLVRKHINSRNRLYHPAAVELPYRATVSWCSGQGLPQT
jgi:hypothetical protein